MITGALSLPAAIYLAGTAAQSKKRSDWVEAGDISQLKPNVPEEFVFRATAWTAGKLRPKSRPPGSSGKRTRRWSPFLRSALTWVVPTATTTKTTNSCARATPRPSALDGKVLTGPAPRALDRYESKIAGNKLLLGEVRKGDA